MVSMLDTTITDIMVIMNFMYTFMKKKNTHSVFQ